MVPKSLFFVILPAEQMDFACSFFADDADDADDAIHPHGWVVLTDDFLELAAHVNYAKKISNKMIPIYFLILFIIYIYNLF